MRREKKKRFGIPGNRGTRATVEEEKNKSGAGGGHENGERKKSGVRRGKRTRRRGEKTIAKAIDAREFFGGAGGSRHGLVIRPARKGRKQEGRGGRERGKLRHSIGETGKRGRKKKNKADVLSAPKGGGKVRKGKDR